MQKIIPLLFALSIPICAQAAPETAAAPTPATMQPKIDPVAFELRACW